MVLILKERGAGRGGMSHRPTPSLTIGRGNFMKLSVENIQSLDLPNVKIAYLEIAGHLAPKLTPLLLEELSLGNHIFSAGVASKDMKDPSTGFLSLSLVLREKGLSKTNYLWVSLAEPFKKKHKPSKGVVYVKGSYGAPHDGNPPDEYRTSGKIRHSLSAPFAGNTKRNRR